MKPKTLEQVLKAVINYYDEVTDDDSPMLSKEEAKQQLLDLFMGCVPDEIDLNISCSENDDYEFIGWNDCRKQMIKNLEKLK